jgi:hypothetical protein
MPNGRTLTGDSHDYKRNGTSTLFAAFEVATGKEKVAHKNRRRRVEFLAFMSSSVAGYPKRAIHVRPPCRPIVFPGASRCRWIEGVPALISSSADATSEIYSMSLVEEEGIDRASKACWKYSPRTVSGQPLNQL